MGYRVGLPPKLQPARASSSAGMAAAEAATRRRGRVIRKRMVVFLGLVGIRWAGIS